MSELRWARVEAGHYCSQDLGGCWYEVYRVGARRWACHLSRGLGREPEPVTVLLWPTLANAKRWCEIAKKDGIKHNAERDR